MPSRELTTSQLDSEIWRLTWPNIISNISVPLLGMADTAIAGHVAADTGIGAVAVGTTVFNFLYWNCGFLRMGTGGVTAQAFGRGDFREAFGPLGRGLFVAMMLGALLLLFREGLTEAALGFVGGDTGVLRMASEYVLTRFWAIPASLGLFVTTGWFIGMQDSRTPMLLGIGANVVNVVVSLVLTLRVGLGVEGIAWGTVVAQWLCLGLSLVVIRVRFWRREASEGLRFWHAQSGWKDYLKLNGDIFFRTLCIVIVYTAFSVFSARMGATMLAANSLLMQLVTLFSYLSDGMAYAAESLTGRLVGERNYSTLRRCTRRLLMWGGLIAVVYSALYLVGHRPLLSLFGPTEAVLDCADQAVWWLVALPVVSFAAFVIDGIMFGATQTRTLLASTATGLVVAVAVVLLLPLTQNTLWLAMLLFFAMRGAVLLAKLKVIYSA